jgi:hypothetical protein
MNHIDFPPSLQDLPPVLYKFRRFDEYGWRMLSELEVFFSSPKHLNDPLDTRIPVLYEQGTFKQMYAKNAEMMKLINGDMSRKELKRRARELAITTYRNRNDPERCEAFRTATAEEMDQMAGILSLSAIRDHTLMWSHYADGHRGFCIGIDSRKLLRFADRLAYSGIHLLLDKVRYYMELPKLNPYKLTESQIFMTKLFCKSQEWSYELEYRLLCGERPDFTLQLAPNILHSVSLGAKCPVADRQRVIELMNNKGYSAAIEEARFGETGCLQFKPVNRTIR